MGNIGTSVGNSEKNTASNREVARKLLAVGLTSFYGNLVRPFRDGLLPSVPFINNTALRDANLFEYEASQTMPNTQQWSIGILRRRQ